MFSCATPTRIPSLSFDTYIPLPGSCSLIRKFCISEFDTSEIYARIPLLLSLSISLAGSRMVCTEVRRSVPKNLTKTDVDLGFDKSILPASPQTEAERPREIPNKRTNKQEVRAWCCASTTVALLGLTTITQMNRFFNKKRGNEIICQEKLVVCLRVLRESNLHTQNKIIAAIPSRVTAALMPSLVIFPSSPCFAINGMAQTVALY